MSMPFQDVPGDAWYTDAVTWAYNCGVVSGMSDDLCSDGEHHA